MHQPIVTAAKKCVIVQRSVSAIILIIITDQSRHTLRQHDRQNNIQWLYFTSFGNCVQVPIFGLLNLLMLKL